MDGEIKEYIDYAIKRAVSELKKSGVIRDSKDMIYSDISYMLTAYYRQGEKIPKLEEALASVQKDTYFPVIPKYYQQGIRLEDIALQMGVDVSTITRNKKRLCLEIYIELL